MITVCATPEHRNLPRIPDLLYLLSLVMYVQQKIVDYIPSSALSTLFLSNYHESNFVFLCSKNVVKRALAGAAQGYIVRDWLERRCGECFLQKLQVD